MTAILILIGVRGTIPTSLVRELEKLEIGEKKPRPSKLH